MVASNAGATEHGAREESQSMAGGLYLGERMRGADGVEALTWFGRGDPSKPLVVFIPGSAHHARIAYGGHAGGRSEDFLAHWLNKLGYNFLGISYPLKTQGAPDHTAHPGFTIRAWGQHAAQVAADVSAEYALSGKIILVVWSNGGRSPQAFAEAATARGLEVEFCVSFSATPPNAAIVLSPATMLPAHMQKLRTTDGYINLAHKYDDWYGQVCANSAPEDQEAIIPRAVYYSDYVGHMPVNLLGQGMKHHEDGFVANGWSYMEDSKAHDLASFPLMTTILTDNIIDARHALTDQALWGPFLIGHLYAKYFEQRALTPETVPMTHWRAIVQLLRAAPQLLSVETHGNHFFFVGEVGANQAARDIVRLEERVRFLHDELAKLLDA